MDALKGQVDPVLQHSSKVVYTCPWLTLREDQTVLADGTPGLYAVVEKPAAACVIPFERNGVHLVGQFRYPLGVRTWEFPQGSWPDGGPPGEELARAELAEETGLRACELSHLGQVAVAPGLTSQRCDVFLATGLSQGVTARERTEQDMEQRWFSCDDLTQMVRDGVVIDAMTLAAFSLFLVRQ